MPRVSVIITTYNSAQYLVAAVESVIAQTYPDIDILIIDDGSTDNTRAVLEPYLDRVTYIRQENQERSASRNNGVGKSKGEFIAFLDGDDLWYPKKLEVQMNALEQHPQALMAYGCARIIDAAGQPAVWWGEETIGSPEGQIEEYQEGSDIIFGSPINPSIALMRREAFEQAGGFDPSIHKGIGEDWDFWIRLSRLGTFVRIPDLLGEYRTYGSERESHKRANEYYLERSIYIIQKNAAAHPQRFSDSIVQKAIARIYLQSALASFERNDDDRFLRVIGQAIEKDSGLADKEFTGYWLEHIGLRLHRDGNAESSIRKYLTRLLSLLPVQIRFKEFGPDQILGRVYFHEVFRFYRLRDWTGVRKVIWRGLVADPRWLLNRGAVSIALQSITHRF